MKSDRRSDPRMSPSIVNNGGEIRLPQLMVVVRDQEALEGFSSTTLKIGEEDEV